MYKRQGVALSLNFEGLQAALSSNTVAVEQAPDLVAVMGGEPAVMLDKALEALGGIGKYIKKGQKVVIKPNIGWDRTPELAGNTNPELIKALVKKCFEAGAEKVTVFDHTCDNWQKCYETSGIAAAVKEAGGIIMPGDVYKRQPFLQAQSQNNWANNCLAISQFSRFMQYFTLGVSISPCISPASFNSFRCWETVALAIGNSS